MKYTLGDIARKLDLELRGDASIEIGGIANLADASPGQLTFLFNSAYKKFLTDTQASAVVLNAQDADGCHMPVLISDRPRMTWAHVARLFDPTPVPDGRLHPSALVAPGANIGEGVTIGPNAVIEDNARLGDGVTVGAGCYIGKDCIVGAGTRLFANVSLYMTFRSGRTASSTVVPCWVPTVSDSNSTGKPPRW